MHIRTWLFGFLLLGAAFAGTAQAQPMAPRGTMPPGPTMAHVPGTVQTPGRPAMPGENCGTPDEPKPCPPLPRVPLQSYPGNR